MATGSLPHPTSPLRGVGVSPGTAAGPTVRVTERPPEPAAGPAPDDPVAEAARIAPAAQEVARSLRERTATTEEAAAVLAATAEMAADPSLTSRAEALVSERRLPAERAVHEAAGEFAEMLGAAGGLMAERARDVLDVRDRIVARLRGTVPPGVPDLDGPCVLLARDLAPADTADLDPALVLALATEEGGPTGHTAVLARALGIPAVVAVRGLLEHPAGGAVVDGTTGEVALHPEPVPARAAAVAEVAWDGRGRTSDGHPVPVLANVGSPADARAAVENGAEGVGLFRTEFCFLDARTEPSEATQREAYRAVLEPLAGLPVVVRTLDAGADKPLPFLSMGDEPNPALGVRGLRVAFDRPELLDRQLSAIAGAAADTGARVSVMAPMVATAAEARWFAERARAAGLERVGVMVETPAAALAGPALVRAVDFVSVGTNDLAQYTFAADRLSGALAELNDPWQPALLRLVAELARAGQEHGVPVGVCGEAAADPRLAGVLAGAGVSSLSMSAAALAPVGSALAGHTREAFGRAARAALAADSPQGARDAAARELTAGEGR
ncbi:phosphoenolpyruvate--protein phosphotransferase [Nocardiopsis sp. HNM0947]|uniref:Phosphoenolpyruvate-protein phosphotransferase n=1 Tax=Nocardiopsis coralli TaxID=2772213 RepID=A0ABR9P461_9ACTN|nr:putative PEP-binding protein [Nocardiopsis coralli]MBE2998628.1 phosphoenolpyruvate--protein phosphotransferase [Nocardiopsis coralli]